MQFNPDTRNSVLTRINSGVLDAHRIQLYVKRDDLIHPEVSGNKWRKLKYNILQCQQQKNIGILTFGGAFSNHLVATAAACNLVGLKAVGIVRGDELKHDSNETLKRCHELGMHLHFVSREEYYLRSDRAYHEALLEDFSNFMIVPEGGANYLGMIGCQEVPDEIEMPVDRYVLAQGTTTTSCGIALALDDSQKLSVVPTLKGFDASEEMRSLLMRSGISLEIIEECLDKTEILDEYHFGGYAKFNADLIQFVRNFHVSQGLKLDPIYTGKAMFALMDRIEKGVYRNETIVFIHTGGLQGISGVEDKLGEPLFQ